MHDKQYPIIISLCYAIARAHTSTIVISSQCLNISIMHISSFWIYLLLKQRSQIASTTDADSCRAKSMSPWGPWCHGSDEYIYIPPFLFIPIPLNVLCVYLTFRFPSPQTPESEPCARDDHHHHPVEHETYAVDGTPDGFSVCPAPATRSQFYYNYTFVWVIWTRSIVWISKNHSISIPAKRPKTQGQDERSREESTKATAQPKPHIPFPICMRWWMWLHAFG